MDSKLSKILCGKKKRPVRLNIVLRLTKGERTRGKQRESQSKTISAAVRQHTHTGTENRIRLRRRRITTKRATFRFLSEFFSFHNISTVLLGRCSQSNSANFAALPEARVPQPVHRVRLLFGIVARAWQLCSPVPVQCASCYDSHAHENVDHFMKGFLLVSCKGSVTRSALGRSGLHTTAYYSANSTGQIL